MGEKVFKLTGLFVVLLLLVYASWVLVAMNRTATISVDYVALLNETAAAVPEDQRGWLLYREVGIALLQNGMPSSVFYEADIKEPTWPDEEGWNYFDDWLESHSDSLDALHEAATKTGFGYVLNGRVSDEDKELWPDQYASQQTEEPHDGFVLSVLLPQFGPLRHMAKLLAVDAKSAAVEGDSQRCVRDIKSILQLGDHVKEHPLLISELVSHSIYSIAFTTLGQIVEHEPTLFSTEQFASLEISLEQLEKNLTVRLDGERYFILDLLQRIYTDDGNGDGSIIPVATAKLLAFTDTASGESTQDSSLPTLLLAPVADVLYPSRKEMHDYYTLRLNFAEERSGIPLYELKEQPNIWEPQWANANSLLDSHSLVNLLAPSFHHLMLLAPSFQRATLLGEYTRAKRDATLAILYAVQIHNETGQWPSDLAGAGVVDAWNNQPLLISVTNGKPVVYSVGFNQVDDGGLFDKRASGWSSGSDGDWIIWPSPE